MPMQRIFWSVWRRDQGQAVTLYRPQVAGAAEGVEGDADGLRLTHDGSTGFWSLYRGTEEIASANGPMPEVDFAIRVANGSILGGEA
jgi:hypothetical protein